MFPKKNVPRILIISIDLLISAFSLFLAYLIRFDLKADKATWLNEWNILAKFLVVFFIIRFLVFYLFKVHQGIVRHSSTSDFKRLFFAVSLSTLLLFIGGILRYYFVDGKYLFPTSVLIIEYVFCFFLTTVFRFTVKLLYLETKKTKESLKRVLIYGAGVSGQIAKRTLEKDGVLNYDIVGFLDENEALHGKRIEGLSVYSSEKLTKLNESSKIDLVIIAIQKPNELKVKSLITTCLDLGIEVKKVPSTTSWINGEFSSKQIAQVKIEDLLGRQEIALNMEQIEKALSNEKILVTGAAGSIGSGLALQILRFNPKEIVLLDQAESPMYELELELRNLFPKAIIHTVMCDICNEIRMEKVFQNFQPTWVFHAAAYKHVPLMEENPSEAVNTNIRGTKTLVEAAIRSNVKKFVMVSTDKAVNPTNVMGASKRIAEIIAQNANSLGSTQFITTRFGNVLGSNGSVIPLFKKQIEQGGPITLTDERITRYFMTIPEACQLVLEAGVMGNGGEIFVFDMGESVRIIDLAKNMIRLSGLELGKDIEIKITGLRPGEKMYEELLNNEENTLSTHHPKILKAKERDAELVLMEQINELIENVSSLSNNDLVAKMKQIVPEFISNNSIYATLDAK